MDRNVAVDDAYIHCVVGRQCDAALQLLIEISSGEVVGLARMVVDDLRVQPVPYSAVLNSFNPRSARNLRDGSNTRWVRVCLFPRLRVSVRRRIYR